MKILFPFAALLICTAQFCLQAQTLPPLPKAELKLFATTTFGNEPTLVGFQTASTNPQGAVTWAVAELVSNAKGEVSGTVDLAIFAPNSNTSIRSNSTLRGRISNPRLNWSKVENGLDEGSGLVGKYQMANFYADFSGTVTIPKTKDSFILKGIVIYAYRVWHYPKQGTQPAPPPEDESLHDFRISVFGPNGQTGFVSGD